MGHSYILFESASGYALFEILQAEEITDKRDESQTSWSDFQRFSKIVKLKAFQPFKSAENALENIMNLSENLIHEDLETFLENNLPSPKQKKSLYLGVASPNFGSAIQEVTQLPCRSNEVILELTRSIRLHFERFVKALRDGASTKAQLGLGHSYSRAKVKFNVNRQDNMVIQTICLLDQLDKDLNTCAMRVKEWYSWHFPELQKIVADSFMFAKLVQFIGQRNSLSNESLPNLSEITLDEAVSQQILDAARSSMGFEMSKIDMLNLSEFAERVIELGRYRLNLQQYLTEKMTVVAPNLASLIGETVAARLISHSGSLLNLAKCPASTIQILGAEKALFRALKTRGNTPKYGLIFHSSFIGRANAKNKGRISRYLANKCAIASRIDSFSEFPSPKYGEKLRQQVEDRLLFYDTGKTPRKNIDVMNEVAMELANEQKTLHGEENSPKKKLKKKRKLTGAKQTSEKLKKKKKKKLKSSEKQTEVEVVKSVKSTKKRSEDATLKVTPRRENTKSTKKNKKKKKTNKKKEG